MPWCHTQLARYKASRFKSTHSRDRCRLVQYTAHLHAITAEYRTFLLTLDSHFLIAGDWNAKHNTWRSRLTTPIGRNILKAIHHLNLKYLSTGEPTYWPADLNKIPDLLDFAVTKGISEVHSAVQTNFDLSSDHSAILITLSANLICKTPPPKLFTAHTNWKDFQLHTNRDIKLT